MSMLNKSDISRDACQLYGMQAKLGYDWWWHSFTGINEKTGEEKAFGPCLLENKDPVLHEWLKRKKETGDRILRDLAGINTDSAMKRRQALQEERQIGRASCRERV